MGKIVVNAVGEQCPIPVVKATRALRGMTEPGILEVHVDNEIAVQNLTRMAAGHKLEAKSEKLGEKEFVVSMEVTDPAGEAPLEEGLVLTIDANLYLDRGVPATNAGLVERAATLIRLYNKRPATPAEARRIMGIPPLKAR